MASLESRVDRRVRELRGAGGGGGGGAGGGGPTDAEVEFLLDAMPFIRDYYREDRPAAPEPSSAMGGYVQVAPSKLARAEVLHRYQVEVEGTAVATPERRESWTCDRCDAKMLFDERESQLVCEGCGLARFYAGCHVTFQQETQQMNKVVVFAYKRMNHFTDWLNCIQGKENKEIPRDVLDAIKAEFKKARATRRSDVTPAKVQTYLRKLKLTDYYDNSPSICRDIGGMPPPQLPRALEDRLKQMFNDVQGPFQRAKPPTRKNFLSYGYVLRKFCQLLSEDSYAAMFPLLKSQHLVKLQDQIWAKICAEMGWQFIPSI